MLTVIELFVNPVAISTWLSVSFENLKSRILSRGTEIEIAYIEKMEDTLNEADFENVLTWFHCDDRIQRILREEKESSVRSARVLPVVLAVSGSVSSVSEGTGIPSSGVRLTIRRIAV